MCWGSYFTWRFPAGEVEERCYLLLPFLNGCFLKIFSKSQGNNLCSPDLTWEAVGLDDRCRSLPAEVFYYCLDLTLSIIFISVKFMVHK